MKKKSTARKVIAFALIVFGTISWQQVWSSLSRMPEQELKGSSFLAFLPPLLILLAGILLLALPARTSRARGDFWMTDDPQKAQKVIQKLKRVKTNTEMMRIGMEAPLDEVAREAFARVTLRSCIKSFVLSGGDSARQLLALEYVTHDGDLREIAEKCGEPISSAALARIHSQETVAELIASSNARTAKRAAAHVLRAGDPGRITDAARLVLKAKKTPQAKDFIAKASKRCPNEMLRIAYNTWACGLIRATAWEALGQHGEAVRARLACADFSDDQRRKAAAEILASSDEREIEKTVETLLGYEPDAVTREFVLNAATARPELIKPLWPKLREWGRHSSSLHTDYTDKAPHVDSTQYYDFYRYPDGRTVPKRDGRKKHTDGPLPSSDCVEYGHQDYNTHTDNARDLKKYLGCFPKAVTGE